MCNILLLNDMHISEAGDFFQQRDSGLVFEQVLQTLLTEQRPDMVLLNGDLCATDPVAETYQRVRSIMSGFNTPVMSLPGNHDDPKMMQHDLPLPHTVLRQCGGTAFQLNPADPYCGWCNLQGWGILWLNTSDNTLNAQQIDWLNAVSHNLVAEHGTIVFMHHPPTSIPSRFMETNYPLHNRAAAWAALAQVPALERVFCGHYHRTWNTAGSLVTMVSSSLYTIDPESENHRILHYNPGYARIHLNSKCSYTVAELPENMLQT